MSVKVEVLARQSPLEIRLQRSRIGDFEEENNFRRTDLWFLQGSLISWVPVDEALSKLTEIRSQLKRIGYLLPEDFDKYVIAAVDELRLIKT